MRRFFNRKLLEAGLDEAGRGPLFGRVYTAAVILNPEDPDFDFSKIKDSKRFKNRTHLLEVYDYIKENAVDYCVDWACEKEIDKLNIRNATYHSMHRAVDGLSMKPDLLLVDGNDFIPYIKPSKNDDFVSIVHNCIVKGDDTYTSIAAASILAKVERDNYIIELCKKYPYLKEWYSLDKNKGYGSKPHIDGIKKHGISEFHRKTFGICKQYS